MSKSDLVAALASDNAMAEYLEVRNDSEIISDIKLLMAPDTTLRDRFAMAALTGAMTSATNLGSISRAERWPYLINTAAIIYEVADAMIEVRSATDDAATTNRE
jgi:hypothetical protein